VEQDTGVTHADSQSGLPGGPFALTAMKASCMNLMTCEE